MLSLGAFRSSRTRARMEFRTSFPRTIMSTTLAPAPASAAPGKKAMARTALVDLKESSRTLLTECFRQYGIETVAMSSDAAQRLRKEKFEACVLSLASDAEPVLESARNSPTNSRCVIYGMGGNAQEAMRFSKYGINAMFQEPLERPAALKLVRATHLLVLHEFRRYVRIPVMTEVSIVSADGRRFSASSIEMSTGGMSIKTGEEFNTGNNVEVSFALLTLPRVTVRGVVSWRKAKSIGVRFDANDDRRIGVKRWVDSCLGH
jgi:Tfp pilus assembly protein PilZ